MKWLAVAAALCASSLVEAAPGLPQEARSQHWTDSCVIEAGRCGARRTRTIKNWSNYKKAGETLWRASNPRMVAGASDPGIGVPFSRGSEEAPLQVWARDAQTQGRRALVLARRADEPGAWIQSLPLNVNAVDVAWTSDTVFEYVGLWDGVTLRYTVGPAALKEDIIITDKALAPAYFEFSYLAPGSWSMTVDEVAGTLSLKDDQGREKLGSRPLLAYDSSAPSEPGLPGGVIAVTLTDQGTQQGRRVVRVTPGDLSAAVEPITIDPTIAITGTDGGDVEDSYIASNQAHLNYGGRTYAAFGVNGASQYLRAFYRIATSALPAMTACSVFRGDFNSNTAVTNAGTLAVSARRVLRAWVEGSADGVQQAGSLDFTDVTDGTLAWTTAGAQSAGNDVAAVVSALPSYTIAASYANGVAFSVTLADDGLTWPPGWKNGTFANQGFLIGGDAVGADQRFALPRSTENVTSQPSFYLDYTAPVTEIPLVTHSQGSHFYSRDLRQGRTIY